MTISSESPGSLRDLASAVARGLGPGHVAEPHDRWRPEEADAWYLLRRPLRHRPFYREAKGLLLEEDGRTLAAFYFEKGMGPDALPPSQVMDDEWRWASLLRLMREGKLGHALEDGARAAGVEPTVLVSAGAPGVIPKSLAYRRFRLVGDGVPELEALGPTGPDIVALPDTPSLAALADALDHLPRPQWTWVNVMLGAIFDVGPSPMHAVALLRPFAAFL